MRWIGGRCPGLRRIPRVVMLPVFLLCVGASTFLGFRAGRIRDQNGTEPFEKELLEKGLPWNKPTDPVVKLIVPVLNVASDGRLANYQTRSDIVPRTAPGEFAKPIPFSAFTDKNTAKQLFKKEMFNLMASDNMSLQRFLPERRDKQCRKQKYDWDLPSASVIIVYFNEPLSTLLRTIWSVINRSRPEHLREIILVDDASDRAELLSEINEYLTDFGNKVRIIRSPVHQGLIKGKLRGARNASGDVLVFLDAHCEVNVGWLEPLLSRIKDNKKLIACPLVDSINPMDMGYTASASYSTGLFTWSLYFKWGPREMIAAERKRVKNPGFEPHKTPTFAGGLFAMNREWFFEVGSYDEEMEGWGGENLEMSFRVWMCHGSIEFVPCSRVGHISRAHTYNYNEQDHNHGINSARLAEVWMDDYKRLFYLTRPDLKAVELGDVTKRLELRSRLQCHDFRWYLENVYPEKFIPDENVRAWGQLKNKETGMCLNIVSSDKHKSSKVDMQQCVNEESRMYWMQVFSFSMENEIRREEWCIDGEKNGELNEFLCSSVSHRAWSQTNDLQLVNKSAKKCLDLAEPLSEKVLLKPCNTSSASQQWSFEFYDTNSLPSDSEAVFPESGSK